MNFYNIFMSLGFISWLICCCCLALIGLRNSIVVGPYRPVTKELRPFDVKLAKIGGILFLLGILFFVVGSL